MYTRYAKLRFALSEAGLAKGYLPVLKIPPPTQPIFRDHTVKGITLIGGTSLEGWAYYTMTWSRLDTVQFWKIRRLVELALGRVSPEPHESAGDGYLYFTMDRSNGTKPGLDFVDAKGVPQVPDPNNDSGIQRVVSHSNIVLVINAVEILNEAPY